MTRKTKREDYNDLCMTCKDFSSCMYVKNGNRPVLQCEEFEVYSNRLVIQNKPAEKRKEKACESSFTGICKNCDNRETCMNAKPERVIWHCEEYV